MSDRDFAGESSSSSVRQSGEGSSSDVPNLPVDEDRVSRNGVPEVIDDDNHSVGEPGGHFGASIDYPTVYECTLKTSRHADNDHCHNIKFHQDFDLEIQDKYCSMKDIIRKESLLNPNYNFHIKILQDENITIFKALQDTDFEKIRFAYIFGPNGEYAITVTMENEAFLFGPNDKYAFGNGANFHYRNTATGFRLRSDSCLTEIMTMASGDYHSIGVATEDFSFLCWGSNQQLQLNETLSSREIPSIADFVLAATDLRNDPSLHTGTENIRYTLWCNNEQCHSRGGLFHWSISVPIVSLSSNSIYNPLTDSSSSDKNISVWKVAAGRYHSLFLLNNTLVVHNRSNYLPESYTGNLRQIFATIVICPEDVSPFLAVDIACSATVSYILTQDRTVISWGWRVNEPIQEGNPPDPRPGDVRDVLENAAFEEWCLPQKIPGLSAIVKIEAADHYLLALNEIGTMYVYGTVHFPDGGYRRYEPPRKCMEQSESNIKFINMAAVYSTRISALLDINGMFYIFGLSPGDPVAVPHCTSFHEIFLKYPKDQPPRTYKPIIMIPIPTLGESAGTPPLSASSTTRSVFSDS